MPGANHTKSLLAQSLQELMLTMPLEKISVNDIVEHAGVGRNTFYYHFEDKYDLVNWYFQTGVTHFLATRTNYTSWINLMDSIEEYLRENRVFYTNALRYTGQNSLQEYIFDFFASIVIQRLTETCPPGQPPLSEADARFIGNFVSGAFMGVLIPWVDRGMKEHISSYYGCLSSLCRGDLLARVFTLCEQPETPPPEPGA